MDDVEIGSTKSRLMEQDEVAMAEMGHVQELARTFNIWSMLALAFAVLGTWSTFAQDLDSGLTNGGSITIIWGLLVVTLCNICVALSLGELCSAMPTALGQAYWVYRLWDTPIGRFCSYLCAWINTFGWWTLTASQVAFMTNIMLEFKVMWDENWTGASLGWLQFVVYVGIAALFTIINCVSCRSDKVLPWFNNIVGIQFGTLFVVFALAFLIAVGSKADLEFQSGKFAFGQWINQTGWPDGVVWFTGLLQAAYGLTAFDSVIHMVEEIPQSRKNAPKVIWLAVLIGAISGGVFMLVCLFCIQDVDNTINSYTGFAFIQLCLDTIGLKGATVLLALFEFNGLGQGVSIATTGSRLTWGFARDGGIPFSKYFAKVDPTWNVPVRALWLQGFLIALIGVLYLFASTVLDAILSVSTIALTISYVIPILTVTIVGRKHIPPGPFKLGRFGPFANWVSIIYCCITTVFFFFPGTPNPSGSDMNYAIAVFGVMLVVAIGFWFTKGRNTYLMTDDAIAQMLQAQQLENQGNDIAGVPAATPRDHKRPQTQVRQEEIRMDDA
uniref:ARAD1D49984p n=1 Tax=Blastobotrys adeninivorans TaxID=409370 RepID=A0A060TJW4_BLAAD